jgi:hypothetical protein
MPSMSQDWSALASHNERVVTAAVALPPALADPEPADPQPQPCLDSNRAREVRGRLRLLRRAGRTGTAARA